MPVDPLEERILAEALPALQRLSLTYAPRRSRLQTLALLALDTRLAGIVRSSHEPLLAQLRLAWWRETLTQDAKDWPVGEPLLAALRSWNGSHGALSPLIDGWEAMIGAAPLGVEAFKAFANGRGEGFAALASAIGASEHAKTARSFGEEWVLLDLVPRLGNDAEIASVIQLLDENASKPRRLPRSLRSLVVLHGVSVRSIGRGGKIGNPGAMSFLTAIRLGLLGR